MSPTSVDPTGFPMIALEKLGLAVQLLPVCKVQFEQFLAEQNEFNDSWYEQILQLNPRVSTHDITAENREGVFLTGILPDEVNQFVAWLGETYRLPTLSERYEMTRQLPARIRPEWLRQTKRSSNRNAKQILNSLSSTRMVELAQFEGGVMEWVTHSNDYYLVGEPRSQFHSQLFDANRAVKPTSLARHRLFGFRLVRKL